jgi:hypothetical protein
MFNRVVKRVGCWALVSALALVGCPPPVVPPHPHPLAPDEEARATLDAFLQAEQAQDFNKVYGLLDAPLRTRYTPERLQTDYNRDQELAHDKLARIRAALQAGTPLQVYDDGRAELPLGPHRAVELVKEQTGWKVHSLE